MANRLAVPRPDRLRGEVRVPGDKSISHRALIFGAIARGSSRIRNFLPSLDCLSTARCLGQLGVDVECRGQTEVHVGGKGLAGLGEPTEVLDAGNSGTTLRLLAGLLAGRPFHAVLTGDDSLRRRPMARIVEPLSQMGCSIRGREDNRYAPLSILGGSLHGIRYGIPVASAQVKSCLVLAGLQARGPSEFVEASPTRDHTERMLSVMGARLRVEGPRVRVRPCDQLEPIDIIVPGDVSSALFPAAAAILVPGSRVAIRDVGLNPTRIAALAALRRMGAPVVMSIEEERAGEPVGTISVEAAPLMGTEIGGAEIPFLIDEIPILAVVATQAHGRTVVRDAAELRVKESDRIEVLVGELQRMGAQVHALPDGMVVDGPTPLRGIATSSHGDHRIGMALYVAGLIARGRTTIGDPEAMDVSFPGFDRLMRRLGR